MNAPHRPFLLSHQWEPFVDCQFGASGGRGEAQQPPANDDVEIVNWDELEQAEANGWAMIFAIGIACFFAGALATAGIALAIEWLR